MAGFFNRLKESLTRTRQNLVQKVEELVTGRTRIDDELYDELEEVLISADVGAETALQLVERLRQRVKAEKIGDPACLKDLLQQEIAQVLGEQTATVNLEHRPAVVLVIGVNGVGKTTTIAKLAHRWQEEGRQVLLAAGDTFRAAAIDQLEVWGRRTGIEVIRHQAGADPGAVAFDAVQAGRSRGTDVVIMDTAGRLHNKSNLMEELKKVSRVLNRAMPGAPHETLLVLDATTGQNAINQARIFNEALGVTGLVLTKLDGTAKGGVVVAIQAELDIPVKFVGVGEGMADLRDFDPAEFARALFAGDGDEEEG